MTMETLSEQRCFDGIQGFYRFRSEACAGPMRFGVFRPPQAERGSVPVLFCLAGLTCSEETFAIKAGAQRVAAELGLMLVTPDTSPRETGIDGEADDWEFGAGAGFYLDATQTPWSKHFRMETHVVDELPALLAEHFAADVSRMGILGHSMGGHGALTLALRHPGRYRSVSAFAPIVAPTAVPWGQKALPRYLGDDQTAWQAHDACCLVRRRPFDGTILIDQGMADRFLDEQLRPELFEAACVETGQDLILNRREGHDHSYWFIASFVESHLRHHAANLH